MRNIIRTLFVSTVICALAVGAMAEKPAPAKKAEAMTCPVCHMKLSAKKTKADPIAVRLKKGGKVMYCCAGCKMPASVLVKPAKATPKKKA